MKEQTFDSLLNKDFYDISLATFERYQEDYKKSRTSPIVYWAYSKFGFSPFWYQTIMLDTLLNYDKISWRIGRQTGKTTCLSIGALYIALARPIIIEDEKVEFDIETGKMKTKKNKKTRGAIILAASSTQDKASVIFDNIFNFMYRNPDTKRAIDNKLINKKMTPYPTITFPNGAVIDVRGPGEKGDSPRGKTYDYLLIDEADYQPPAFWSAVQATTVNTPQLHLLLASTIRGIRGYFYDFCRRSKEIHLPTYVNPNYDANKDDEYKAMLPTEEYDHEIKADWSSSSNAAFNIEDFEACRKNYEEYAKLDINRDYMQEMERRAGTQEDQKRIMLEINKDLTERLKKPDPYKSSYYIGCDLGFNNDPSEMIVFQKLNREGKVKLITRLHLSKVNYYLQAYIITLLDSIYNAEMICIDKGAAGVAVEHIILNDDIFKCVRKLYKEKLCALAYNANIVIGYEDGDKNKPINRQCKQFATSIINNFLSKREIIFPFNDPELHYQIINHTFTLGEMGIIYRKGDDHLIDAIRFGVLAVMLSSMNRHKKLPSPAMGSAGKLR